MSATDPPPNGDRQPTSGGSIVVRRATVEDAGTLIQLNETVQDLHVRLYPADFKHAVARSEAASFFLERLKNPDCILAIAEVALAPAGYVWFDRQSRPETPFTPARRRLYLHHISVKPEVHRRGVGSALMKYVEQWAAQESAQEIALATWSANLGAQRFFISHGFSDVTVAFRKTFAEGC
jgi:ribosomal protein S18 acetylase RimI-like enzyme